MQGITPVILHHRMPDGKLVLCDSSPNGVPLTKFLPKKPKFECCSQCLHYHKRCGLGYVTTANSRPCLQGTPYGRQRP